MTKKGENSYLLRVARNTGIIAAGRLVNFATAPLTAIVTTRALGPELYGVYVLANYWTALLADISRLGFGRTVIRFTATYKGQGRMDRVKAVILLALKVSFIGGGLMTLALMFFAGPFSARLLHNAEVARAFRFFAPAIFLTALYGCGISALAGFQEQKHVVVARDIVGSVVKLGSLAIFLFFGMKLYAALASSLLQDLALLVLGMFFLVKVFPELREKSLAPDTETGKLWKFSGMIFLTGIFNRHVRQLDLLVLGMFRPLHEVGLYGLALRLQPLIYMPHRTIMQIFGPVVSELHAKGESEELKSLYKTVTKWTSSFSVPIFMTVVFFHEPILGLFGKEYGGTAAALLILCVGSAFTDMFAMSGQVITMIGRPGVNMANSAVMAVVSVVLFVTLIPRHGILGAALAYTIVQVLVNIMRVLEVRFLVGVAPFKESQWKTFVSAAAGALAVLAARRFAGLGDLTGGWLIECVVLWASYALVTWKLGLDEEDMIVIGALKRKLSRSGGDGD